MLTIAAALALAAILPGQTVRGSQKGENDRAIGSGVSSPVRPLSAGAKFKYNFVQSFNAASWFRNLAGAGIDQWYGTPNTWPENWEGFGDRLGDKVGERFTRNMLIAATQSLLHEDPRPLRTTATGIWPRTSQAILHTFETRTDSGGTTFNVAQVVGAYGNGFISRSWMPPGYRSAPDAMMDGTVTLAVNAGFSVVREFWPDVKSRLFHRR
jgi:hypothetical protein